MGFDQSLTSILQLVVAMQFLPPGVRSSQKRRGAKLVKRPPAACLFDYYGAIRASLCIDVTLRALLLAPLPLN